ncbi:unnamed protein product [Triticum turgidum subsp. durum]|uniref:Protein kinase domain-containing protein n=1 Tax=Triticum turgidum subsp. durum TaxID=4567 RepID=A0A9R1PB65_TRITD|nr:unnamed protein product [Triticum turgidum subsp. durum]
MDHATVVPSLSYHLLDQMTNGFSEDRELGRGTYGKVYLGLHTNGEKIAVKMLHPMLGLDDELFEKEYHNLENLQHQNVVRLVGYCNETRREYVPYNGKMVLGEVTHRALCFEYMQNGSLNDYLSDESSGHDWHTRYAIIKGICKGLKYLHEELEPPMIHSDLKPANVLLDENCMPKIGDFGLSRLMEEQTRITTTSVGTIGYLPPEHINGRVISNKLDIFSLGVIIIKIIAGPTGYSKSAEISSQQFIELVHRNWRNRLQAASVNALESYCIQVKRCTEIALSCVEVDRHKRPTIGNILNELNETETSSQFPDALLKDLEPTKNQESQQTHITEAEEKREREELIETANCFGEVVDNCKLDKMARYMGKHKTREDRAREAWNLVDEHDKDDEAFRYVKGLKSLYGNGQSTLCRLYNATGDTLYQVANYDWSGHIGRAPYPATIGNGQWAAFHHIHRAGESSGSVAAVVYRGKNKHGQDKDYIVAWSTPCSLWHRNKAYCGISDVSWFQKNLEQLMYIISDADYSSSHRSGGCEIEARIGRGHSPKFTARISYR